MRWLLAALLAVCFAVPANAQGCRSRDEVLDYMAKKYGEAPAYAAVVSGGLLEVLVSENGATWTIILTRPGIGVSCPFAAGEGWRAVEPKPTGPQT